LNGPIRRRRERKFVMNSPRRFFSGLLRDDSAASAVEYGLLVAAIAAVIVAILFSFGTVVHGTFFNLCEAISQKANVGVECMQKGKKHDD
jgi:pilus assembly protein Flp/PilA